MITMFIDTVFNLVIDITLPATILALAIILFKKLFGKHLSAGWNYYIWLLLIFRLLVPYIPQVDTGSNVLSTASQYNIANLKVFKVYDINKLGNSSGKQVINTNKSYVDKNENFGATDLKTSDISTKKSGVLGFKFSLSIIWILGSTAVLLYIITINFIFHRKIKHSCSIKDPELLSILETSKSRLNFNRKVQIIKSSIVISPCVYGVITPKVLLNGNILKLMDTKEVEHILMHELIHIKRKDQVMNWLMVFICAVYWFNLIVWYSMYRMKEDCEISCDDHLLNKFEENPLEYGQTIINSLSTSRNRQLTLSLGLINKSQIKRRIMMIKGHKKKTLSSTLMALVLTLTIITMGFATGFTMKPAPDKGKLPVEFQKLITSKASVSKLIKYMDANISKMSKTDASLMITSFEGEQIKYLPKLANKYFSGNTQAILALSSKYPIDPKKYAPNDENTADLLKETVNSGYTIIPQEGTYSPIIDYSFYKKYSKYVLEDIKAYIDICAVESNKVPTEDGGLLISWDEVFNRALKMDTFVNTYKTSTKLKDVKLMLNSYFNYAIYGLNNTPLFSYENKKMFPEAIAAYKKVATKDANTTFMKAIKNYYDEIVKNKFILNAKLTKYRDNLAKTTKF